MTTGKRVRRAAAERHLAAWAVPDCVSPLALAQVPETDWLLYAGSSLAPSMAENNRRPTAGAGSNCRSGQDCVGGALTTARGSGRALRASDRGSLRGSRHILALHRHLPVEALRSDGIRGGQWVKKRSDSDRGAAWTRQGLLVQKHQCVLPVAENFVVFADCKACLLARGEALIVDQFIVQLSLVCCPGNNFTLNCVAL